MTFYFGRTDFSAISVDKLVPVPSASFLFQKLLQPNPSTLHSNPLILLRPYLSSCNLADSSLASSSSCLNQSHRLIYLQAPAISSFSAYLRTSTFRTRAHHPPPKPTAYTSCNHRNQYPKQLSLPSHPLTGQRRKEKPSWISSPLPSQPSPPLLPSPFFSTSFPTSSISSSLLFLPFLFFVLSSFFLLTAVPRPAINSPIQATRAIFFFPKSIHHLLLCHIHPVLTIIIIIHHPSSNSISPNTNHKPNSPNSINHSSIQLTIIIQSITHHPSRSPPRRHKAAAVAVLRCFLTARSNLPVSPRCRRCTLSSVPPSIVGVDPVAAHRYHHGFAEAPSKLQTQSLSFSPCRQLTTTEQSPSLSF